MPTEREEIIEIFEPQKVDAASHEARAGQGGQSRRTRDYGTTASASGSQDGKRKIIFPLSSFRDFGRDSRPRYLVKGLIPQGGLVVVWGPPKCGKSFWTFDLGMHIARGREYRGHRVSQGLVVYLALEGEYGFRARRDAYALHFLEPDDNPPFFLITTQIDLRRQAKLLIEDIRAQLGDDRPSLIVIDTLNRSLVGSENKDEDMGDYIRAADRIRLAFDCAVLIVHHCGINAERPRGHTSLTGAVDAQMSVRKDDGGNAVTVTVEHMKDGNFGEVIGSQLELVELDPDEDGDPVTSLVVLAVETAAKTAHKKTPKLTAAQKIALNALREAILDIGKTPPASGSIPDAAKAVTIEQWRNFAYRRGLAAGAQDSGRRKAFQRAVEGLSAAALVGISEPYAWLA